MNGLRLLCVPIALTLGCGGLEEPGGTGVEPPRLQPLNLAFEDETTGWVLAGSVAPSYTIGTDRSGAHGGQACGYIRNSSPVSRGFGTLMQSFRADSLLGKRVRLSAYIKAEAVDDWAGLWMRIDGVEKGPGKSLGFDNMQNRPIVGTRPWQLYQIVLDVPQESVGVSFGVLLAGEGIVWIDDVRLEAVVKTTPTTGSRNRG